MQPTLQTQTSVGLETPQQTLDRAGSMLASSRTPAQLAAPTFQLNMPEEIPSTTLRNPTTFEDVMAKRNKAEQDQFNMQALGGQYDQLMQRIQTPVGATPFQNPEAFLNNLLLNRPTDTQMQLDQARGDQAGAVRDFAGDYSQAGDKARAQLGIGDLQAELGNTRNRIAERTTQLRQTLRDFETNSQRRGVDRQFVDAEKQAVQGKAAAELADLSIIENAQLGNLQQAQGEVDRVLAEKLQSFQFENQAIEAEIKRLEAMDTREADTRKTQLQIALQERTRNIETELANEKEKRSYLIDAAQNGADQGTLDAIRNATTPGEAALLAGPWVGRLDRQLKNAQIANTYDQIAARSEQNKALLGTLNGKTQTESEKMTETYANRMLEANQIINELGSQFTGISSYVGQLVPNAIKNEARQKFEQAQRNFINAVLRKESGAVISDEEFTNAKLQYFPQPGDSTGVLTQKEQNRSTAISSLYNAANVPMPELADTGNDTQLQPGQQYKTKSGLSYTILPNQ